MQALGTALAMVYLHSFDPPIVHRDLRSPNILIGPNWTPKVGDCLLRTAVLYLCI